MFRLFSWEQNLAGPIGNFQSFRAHDHSQLKEIRSEGEFENSSRPNESRKVLFHGKVEHSPHHPRLISSAHRNRGFATGYIRGAQERKILKTG